jgi:hypothetical protein
MVFNWMIKEKPTQIKVNLCIFKVCLFDYINTLIFNMEYFLLGAWAFISFFAWVMANIPTKADRAPQKPYSIQDLHFKPMIPEPNRTWKNNFDGRKVKIIYLSSKWQGDNSIGIVNYVKEGEEQVLSCPEKLFIEQYTPIYKP